MERKLLRVREAAELLGVSKSFLHQLIRQGEIKILSLGPRATRIEPDELDNFIARYREGDQDKFN